MQTLNKTSIHDAAMVRIYHAINIDILLSVQQNLIKIKIKIKILIRTILMYHFIQFRASVKRSELRDITFGSTLVTN